MCKPRKVTSNMERVANNTMYIRYNRKADKGIFGKTYKGKPRIKVRKKVA